MTRQNGGGEGKGKRIRNNSKAACVRVLSFWEYASTRLHFATPRKTFRAGVGRLCCVCGFECSVVSLSKNDTFQSTIYLHIRFFIYE